LDCVGLSLKGGFGEVRQPVRDFVVLVVALERRVIRLPLAFDGVGQGNQAWLSEILSQ
jgi:hypothetical protein